MNVLEPDFIICKPILMPCFSEACIDFNKWQACKGHSYRNSTLKHKGHTPHSSGHFNTGTELSSASSLEMWQWIKNGCEVNMKLMVYTW